MLLSVNGLKKSFKDVEVLKGIDLNIEKGDVLAILGSSGSGKTTLLRCMNFLEKSDAGHMTFEDREFDLSAMKKKDITEIRKKTGFVFQGYNLFRNKSALENVTEGLIIARKMDKDKAVEIARKQLDVVGMLDRQDHYPSQLSGGQQQRVAIARAMATDPKIIYFDEPTSALDPELIGEVLSVMKDLAASGMTMAVVTHEMNFARNVSTRAVFMEDGYIVENRPTAEFFESPEHERTRRFISFIENQRK